MGRGTASLTDDNKRHIQRFVQRFAERNPQIVAIRRLSLEFTDIVKRRAHQALASWLRQAQTSGVPEMQRFAAKHWPRLRCRTCCTTHTLQQQYRRGPCQSAQVPQAPNVWPRRLPTAAYSRVESVLTCDMNLHTKCGRATSKLLLTGNAGLVCTQCGICQPTRRKWLRRYIVKWLSAPLLFRRHEPQPWQVDKVGTVKCHQRIAVLDRLCSDPQIIVARPW